MKTIRAAEEKRRTTYNPDRSTGTQMNDQATVIINEVDIIVDFDAWPSEPRTRNYPGCETGWDINCLIEYGKEMPPDRERRMITAHQDDIDQAIIDRLEEIRHEQQDDYADHLMDRMKDEGLTVGQARGLFRRKFRGYG